MVVDLDARHARLLQINAGAASPANQASEKFAEVRVVPDHHNGFLVAVLGQQVAELRKSGAGTQRGIKINLALVGEFVGDQRGSACFAVSRACLNRCRSTVENACGSGRTLRGRR